MEPLVVTPDFDPNGRMVRAIFDGDIEPIEWIMPEDYGPGFSNDGSSNFLAIMTMPYAMALGRDLHIRGQVCPILLGNLERLMHNRVAFHSRGFKHVKITAEKTDVVSVYDPKAPHIAAYSGGVDATYCIGKNFHDTSSFMHRPVGATLTIGGFGYSLEEQRDFNRARAKAAQLGARYNFKSYAMICNSSVQAKKSWGIKSFSPHVQAHPMFIASCLNLFSKDFGGGLFAADFSYLDEPHVLPWSSQSVTHPLLSSSGFHINAVGADADRPVKLSFLHENNLLSDIVLCGASRSLEKNCGTCRKCRRTIIMCLSRDIDPTNLFAEIPEKDELVLHGFKKNTEYAFAIASLRNWQSEDHQDIRLQLWKEVRNYSHEKLVKEKRQMRRGIGPMPADAADKTTRGFPFAKWFTVKTH